MYPFRYKQTDSHPRPLLETGVFLLNRFLFYDKNILKISWYNIFPSTSSFFLNQSCLNIGTSYSSSACCPLLQGHDQDFLFCIFHAGQYLYYISIKPGNRRNPFQAGCWTGLCHRLAAGKSIHTIDKARNKWFCWKHFFQYRAVWYLIWSDCCWNNKKICLEHREAPMTNPYYLSRFP